MQEEIIKKFFEATNGIVISEMYLNSFENPDTINIQDLSSNNSGHLGTSTSINFILANLYYFLNKNNLKSQLVLGTGHAGVSLMANLWLNGTLEQYDPKYITDRKGLNNLIDDFGKSIRSEINPQYPGTIYDGGELGYSLGVAYGYAIKSKADIVPCIIGDGEAETGTLMSAWQLAKIIEKDTKVLPIINLNGLKMGSRSYLSRLSDSELENLFKVFGYTPFIVDSHNEELLPTISKMQSVLAESLNNENPLIIFKSLKGFTITDFEGTTNVHKNPLQGVSNIEKLQIIKKMLQAYDLNIFDNNGQLLPIFENFRQPLLTNERSEVKPSNLSINTTPDKYLANIIQNNDGLVFSPDEIYSNRFPECAKSAIELLNENLLQALYQGYTQAGNFGYYISYESFMPIISSMITQYYKYLKQKELLTNSSSKNSLNYILTSTCWENTYSHQNPDFVNALFEKNDRYYNILYPKDTNSLKKCIDESLSKKDKINVITISKRHDIIYEDSDSSSNEIEIIKECKNPDLILCATGDYMLDVVLEVSEKIKELTPNIKIIYVTKPQILMPHNFDALESNEFEKYFNKDTPTIYLYCGYASTIKSLLYDRFTDIEVLGYNDGLSIFGNLNNNLKSNEIDVNNVLNICKDKLINNSKKIKIKEK